MPARKPQALYVYAHPDTQSFNHQLFEAGKAALEQTYEVVTSDLYAMGFDPVLTREDLGSYSPKYARLNEGASLPRDTSFLNRWALAHANDQLPDAVRAEQHKLLNADVIVLQFPLWWASVPAILKGWFDRVFTSGFGFDVRDPQTCRTRRYGDGLLLGKRALLSVTLGESHGAISERGIAGDLESLLFGITHGTLFYAGVEVLPLHVIAQADDLDAGQVEREVARYQARLSEILGEQHIPYRALRGGDYQNNRSLRECLLPGRTDLRIHRADG